MKPSFSLLLITNRQACRLPLQEAVTEALGAVPPGAAAVQIREKDLGGRALSELARALLPVCRARSAPLLINDRIDVARALQLDGVHLAGSSVTATDARRMLGPGACIGVSCHSAAEVGTAASGADYAVLGPLFETPSKRAFGPPLGPQALDEASRSGVPLFAIGGVTVERIPALRAAAGLAAIGAALGSSRPGLATAALWEAWLELQRRPSSSGR